jgi:glycosyltransferase involved in cell wall biosynthesis
MREPPLRILHVSEDFLPNPGGIAAHVDGLSRAQAARGHEVALLVGAREADSGQGAAGVRLLGFEPVGDAPWAAALRAVRVAAQLARTAHAFDVVHWHNLTWESASLRAADRAHLRVFTNHSSGFTRRAAVPWRRRLQLPWLLDAADLVICPSTSRLDETRAVVQPSKRLLFVPSGVDLAAFSATAPRPGELAARVPWRRWILAAGRLEPVKGFDRLVEALALLPGSCGDVGCVFVGDGSARRELERRVDELGLRSRVVFVGAQPRAALPGWYAAATVAAVPSRIESGTPLVSLECLSAGVPVVATAVGGLLDVVTADVGLLVPADPAEGVAQGLALGLSRLLAEPPGEHAARRRAAAAHAAGFGWDRIAARTCDAYLVALRAVQSSSRPG